MLSTPSAPTPGRRPRCSLPSPTCGCEADVRTIRDRHPGTDVDVATQPGDKSVVQILARAPRAAARRNRYPVRTHQPRPVRAPDAPSAQLGCAIPSSPPPRPSRRSAAMPLGQIRRAARSPRRRSPRSSRVTFQSWRAERGYRDPADARADHDAPSARLLLASGTRTEPRRRWRTGHRLARPHARARLHRVAIVVAAGTVAGRTPVIRRDDRPIGRTSRPLRLVGVGRLAVGSASAVIRVPPSSSGGIGDDRGPWSVRSR